MIVRRRNASSVIPEGQAKLGSDCRHGLHRYGQREYRHQKQTRLNHVVPPDSKNVLCRHLVMAKYHITVATREYPENKLSESFTQRYSRRGAASCQEIYREQ
jgi:hypothetical protein